MLKNSPIWSTMLDAWDLFCDHPLPRALPTHTDSSDGGKLFNALHFLPLWGAAAGLAAVILWKILYAVLPLNGAALLLALAIVAAGEFRCSGRALALSVTFLENISGGKKFAEAQTMRSASLKDSSGVIPLLLAGGMLGGKFFAVWLTVRAGHSGVLGCALVAALALEALLASEPAAEGLPRSCEGARSEYILMLSGFLLLFNLLALPLPTLLGCGASVVIGIWLFNSFLRSSGRITSDDITMSGYFTELAVWFVTAVMIG
ncbi:MAG: hypothetical protein E7056_08100 [Lentisphaerae bacterium]|nr:hypothetical protein [Lentisphaerota bacterium]